MNEEEMKRIEAGDPPSIWETIMGTACLVVITSLVVWVVTL